MSLRDVFPPAAVKRCEQQLSTRADLTQYTYVNFANDLEQVRRGLGYGRMNISGGSYGTRAAQVIMRAYPESVRTAYLGSVVPVDVMTPLTMAKSAQVALDNTLNACAAEPACNTAFPNLRAEFQQVVERLDTGEVRVAIPGRSGTFPIHRGRVMEWFRSMNYRPSTAAELPWMIHQAFLGDFGPFVDGVLSNARNADAGLSFGLFFSITCNDDVAFMREEDIVRETQGTFLGDYRARQQQAACKQWPKVSASGRLSDAGALGGAHAVRLGRLGRCFAAVDDEACGARVLESPGSRPGRQRTHGRDRLYPGALRAIRA